MANPLKILLCEDDTDIAFLIKINIIKAYPEAEVFITRTKEETLQTLFDVKYDIDVILLDYLLVNTTGLEILEEIRQITEIPVVIITGQGSEEVAVNAMKLGASDYIVKRGRFFNQIPGVIDKVTKVESKYDLDKIFVSFYRFGESGTDPIYINKIPAEYEKVKETVILALGVLLFTIYGMGELDMLESGSMITGPVKIPKMKQYNATSFLYVVSDESQKDPRFRGKDYCIVALGYPAEYSDLVYGIDKIRNILNLFFEGVNDISEVESKAEDVEEQVYNVIRRF
ncbi:MAG: response regulator [Candidatus Heimdallarchaeota archaeon]|nr:response regulator [Candidatus Heimdallarchaeota archaeon]MCK4878478.1 response regulator [Candidatus Heimdallarchaeota archaeon]